MLKMFHEVLIFIVWHFVDKSLRVLCLHIWNQVLKTLTAELYLQVFKRSLKDGLYLSVSNIDISFFQNGVNHSFSSIDFYY